MSLCVITGVSFAVMSVTGPIWGIVTDATGRQRIVVTVLCLCAAAWITSIPFIGEVFVPEKRKVVIPKKILFFFDSVFQIFPIPSVACLLEIHFHPNKNCL